MNVSGTTKIEEFNTDLAVIGGGGSGLAAAIAATEKGASVIVLETRRSTGGNSALAAGLFTVGKPGQKQEEISALIDDYFRIAMSYSHWKTNPRLVRALIEKSVDIVPWLEAQGVKFEWSDEIAFYRVVGEGRGGVHIMRALANKCQEIGVQVFCETRAKKLLTAQSGRVIGVLAEGKDGEFTVNAKDVIIASGGFAGNQELLKKYFPDYYEEDHVHVGGIPHQGDGLLMATKIGAATDGLAFLELSGFTFPESSYLNPVTRNPRTIWVNKKGERFVDESLLFPESANSIYRQPDKRFYSIFDEEINQFIFEKGLSPMDVLMLPKSTSWKARAEQDLQVQIEKGKVKISDSWDEIASWMGVIPETLKTTIDEYNAGCERGHDIFLKDKQYLRPLRTPPYHAYKCITNILVTHGDIKVNHRLQVLDRQDNPISGLYAVGDDASIADSDTYNVKLGGHSFGFAINSGRIAGENAAKSII